MLIQLLQKSTDIDTFDDKLKDIVIEMAILMRKLKGAGLAAPQVGISKNLFIMEIGLGDEKNSLTNLQVFINPKIISLSENKEMGSEGCLSFPSIFEDIARSTEVEVKYQELDGIIHQAKFFGRFARCIQHEYEHLQGEVFIKHISALKRDMAKRKMTKINSLLGRA